MTTPGPLDPKPAARLLFAAGLFDLMIVYVVAGMIFPHLEREIDQILPDNVTKFDFAILFLTLLPSFWLVTDVFAGGYSPGRLALGLTMSDSSGHPMSLPRRFTRFIGKLMFFGLSGIRFERLSHYDRIAGTTWRCPIAKIAPSDIRLLYLDGKHKGRGAPLSKIPRFYPDECLRLGRDRGWSHLPIEDTTVSARHCEIAILDGSLMIRDLNSSQGTFLNGKRIPSNTWNSLSSTQEFALGRQRFALRR